MAGSRMMETVLGRGWCRRAGQLVRLERANLPVASRALVSAYGVRRHVGDSAQPSQGGHNEDGAPSGCHATTSITASWNRPAEPEAPFLGSAPTPSISDPSSR